MPSITEKDWENMAEEKRFDEWIKLKANLHEAKSIRSIHEGEIWWCAMGENVGVEINGKSKLFSRPVIVLRKVGKLSFVGIPMTSKTWHEGSWYVHFNFHGAEQVAVLSQPRNLSVKRLYQKIGQVDEVDMMKIRVGFLNCIAKNIPQPEG